jgi:hypothetical protein
MLAHTSHPKNSKNIAEKIYVAIVKSKMLAASY